MYVKLRVTYNDAFEDHYASAPEKDGKGIYRHLTGNSVSLRREGTGRACHLCSCLRVGLRGGRSLGAFRSPRPCVLHLAMFHITRGMEEKLLFQPHPHGLSQNLHGWGSESVVSQTARDPNGPTLFNSSGFDLTGQQVLMLRPGQVQSTEYVCGGLRSRRNSFLRP